MLSPEALVVTRIREVKACPVRGCRRSAGHLVCRRHLAVSRAHFGNDIDRMIRELVEEDEFTDAVPQDCYVPWCNFPVAPRKQEQTDPETRLCDGHHDRYAHHSAHRQRTGRTAPTIDDFVANRRENPAPKFKTVGLPNDLSWEVKYALQARSDARAAKWRSDQHSAFLTHLRATGVPTLTIDEDALITAFRAVGATSLSVGFARSARAALIDLRDFGADPHERDVWDLVELGFDAIARDEVRHLDFTAIKPEWLRRLAKQWTKHRLNTSRVTTVSGNLRALSKMCKILEARGVLPERPKDLTRKVLETYILAVRQARYSRNYSARLLSAPRMFFDHVLREGWEPELSPKARLYNDDIPKPGQTLPRYISRHVMAQIETPSSLDQIRGFEAGTILRVIIEGGLRGASARRLAIDPLNYDETGAPYLVYTNTKFDREAVIPISRALAARINEQAARTRQRWPHTSWLTPRMNQNIDGSLPYSKGAWKQQFTDWVTGLELTDPNGHPVRVTPHQFRHTVGTRMVNRGVDLDVVRSFLDHSSVQMTQVYAQLFPETVRNAALSYLAHMETVIGEDTAGPLSATYTSDVAEGARSVIEALFATPSLPGSAGTATAPPAACTDSPAPSEAESNDHDLG
ncbi:MAG: tyrosine-type recombinase/integrase [Nocardioidaceae bacterium]